MEIETIAGLADNLTVIALLLYAWIQERRERQMYQERYTAHLENEVKVLSNVSDAQNI